MRLPAGEPGDRLLNFLRLAEGTASADEIASAALEVDNRLGPLLEFLPGELFWPAVCRLKSLCPYDPDEQGVLYQANFDLVDYPYAQAFAQQFETWIGALGCRSVSYQITKNFSESTIESILNVNNEYKEGRLAVFLGAGVSPMPACPIGRNS